MSARRWHRWGLGGALCLLVTHEVSARLLLELGWAEQLLSPGGGSLLGLLGGLAFVVVRLLALFAAPGLIVVWLGRWWSSRGAEGAKSAADLQDDVADTTTGA